MNPPTPPTAVQAESLGRLIFGLHRYWKIYIDAHLKPYGLGSAQLPVLMALYRHDQPHQEKLARLLHVDKATTTRALQKLEQAGYVVREKDPADKRAFQVRLTGKAQKIKPALREVLANWTQLLSMGLTDHELELAYQLLRRMFENAANLEAALKGVENGS